MRTKFHRARSTASTFHRSQKQSMIEQQIDEISTNTIIPYINQRYEVLLKNTRSSHLPILKNEYSNANLDAIRLACLILVNRSQKLLLHAGKSEFIKTMKLKLFKQKLKKVLECSKQRNIRQGFKKLKIKSDFFQVTLKIIEASFINKKIIHNQLSFAFRQIALLTRQTKQILLRNNKSNMLSENDTKSLLTSSAQSSNLKNSSQNSIKTIKSKSAYTLKPDSYKKIQHQNFSFWKIQP